MATTYAQASSKSVPATESQVNYLVGQAEQNYIGLLEKKVYHANKIKVACGREFPSAQSVRLAILAKRLSKFDASQIIGVLVNQPVRSSTGSEKVEAPTLGTLPAFFDANGIPEFGYYMSEQNGHKTTYSWQEVNLPFSKSPVKKFMKFSTYKAYNKNGELVTKGRWIKYGSTLTAKKVLAGPGFVKLTKDQAGALGKLYGCCIRCGRTLTDPFSVENGIGPVCATYSGWAA